MRYNARGQTTEIGLGRVAGETGLLKLELGYGTASENNGAVRRQTITVPTIGAANGFTAVQTYAYDNLNRLQSASEATNGNQNSGWSQTFAFDRYGNRTNQSTSINGVAQAQNCNHPVK